MKVRNSKKSLRILMMISGTIRGANANDHFYLKLAKRIREKGGEITFYVYDTPPSEVIKEFDREEAQFVVRRKGRYFRLPQGLEVLIDTLVHAYRLQVNLLVGQYSTCGNAVAIAGKFLGTLSIKVVRSISKTKLQVLGKHSKVGIVHRLKQRFLANLASKIIAVSDSVAEDLKETYGIAPNHTVILKNAICPENYHPCRPKGAVRAELDIPDNAFVLLMVAGFRQEKGHQILFHSLTRFDDIMPYVVLAGDGPEMEACESLARKLLISDRIRFLGNRRDVPDLLGASDGAVLPSLSDAFPLYILESMAAGLPVISTRVGGIPEMIVDGETGILVPPGDIDALCDAMKSLMWNKEKVKCLGEAGLQRVLNHFNLERRVDRELGLYCELLEA